MALSGLPTIGRQAPRPGIFGSGSLAELVSYIRNVDAQRVLLLTGRSSFVASGAEQIIRRIPAFVDVYRWLEFQTNPQIVDLGSGIEIVHEFDPDLIVAIGGGSVMDMAKLLCAFDGLRSRAQLESAIRTSTPGVRHRGLVLAPTTSGSGSESTHFAVVYVGDAKFSVADVSLLPDYVFLDPDLTLSGSHYQKATSGADALTQSIESLWATNATSESIQFAKSALEKLTPALTGYVQGLREPAVSMAEGSYLAGRAIDISKTTGPHAMSYGLTKGFGINHGHAVIATFSAFARAIASENFDCQSTLGDGELRDRLNVIAQIVGAQNPSDIGDTVAMIANSVGLTLGLQNLGVPFDALDDLADGVNVERLQNNPVRLSTQALQTILRDSW